MVIKKKEKKRKEEGKNKETKLQRHKTVCWVFNLGCLFIDAANCEKSSCH